MCIISYVYRSAPKKLYFFVYKKNIIYDSLLYNNIWHCPYFPEYALIMKFESVN